MQSIAFSIESHRPKNAPKPSSALLEKSNFVAFVFIGFLDLQALIALIVVPLIGMNVAQEATRSQALRLCLGTHWCGGSCLPSSQTKDAFRRGGASLAVSYQAEPGN